MATGTVSLARESIKNTDISPTAAIDRDKLAQRVLGSYNVPLTQMRVWDALATNLPATPANDDLGLVTGTLGTDFPSVQTGDLKTAGATTRYARFQVQLPDDYEDGETVTLRLTAGMKTTVADVSATIDAQVYSSDGDGTVSADLCADAAQSINSLTADSYDFDITATSLTKGMILDVRIAIAVNDAATGTAVIGCLYEIELLSDRR